MRFVALALLAGCLRTPDFAGVTPFDRCTFGNDDPLRYAAVSATSGGPLSWDSARAACIRRGMDLAVMNDAHELGAVDPEQWPAWVGVSQASTQQSWVAVDGCPVFGLMPGAVSGTSCGIVVTGNELMGNPCDGTVPNGDVITRAVCETPHPDVDGCRHDPKSETYSASPAPLSYAAAAAFCQSQSAHLVVINSADELQFVTSLVPTVVALDFWIGEKWDGTVWRGETACPGEFSWTDKATLTGTESCTFGVVQNGPVVDPDVAPVLALQGQELAPCDTMKLALCERE